MNKNVLTFIACDAEYEESDTVIFGVPFDGTTSFRPGTRFASETIRIDSLGLETYSPYIDKDLLDRNIFDAGDLELPFGNVEKSLKEINNTVRKILDDNKKPFIIGGEHLVTLPAVEEVIQNYPDLHIIHLDAHTDLREDYLGQKLSHATVIKRVWDLLGDNRIYQFGIRSGLKEEFEFSKAGHTYMEKFSANSFKDIIERLTDKPVYITIDLDILDPSIFPGTGTPEPGGLTFKELIDVMMSFKQLNIVGGDVVELSPHYDHTGVSTAVACKVIREFLLSM